MLEIRAWTPYEKGTKKSKLMSGCEKSEINYLEVYKREKPG